MIENGRPLLNIKGIREGLLITVGDGPYEAMLQRLQTELAEKQAFLQGSQVALQVGQRPLRKSQLLQLKTLLARYGLKLWAVLAEQESTRGAARELALATRLSGSQTDLEGNTLTSPGVPAAPSAPDAPSPRAAAPPNALVLKETVRSGRSIYSHGSVVIIGDVNPGAEIIAGGDVVVWGRLRGMVHAGALGDETAVICALVLNPTQLRIAGQIAVSPAERQTHPAPEQVSVRDGRIVAEPWPSRI